MTTGKYPKLISEQDVWQATYDLSSAYTINIYHSKKALVGAKETIYEYKLEIIKNNFIITHKYVTKHWKKYDKIWWGLFEIIKTQPFTEKLAETLGFIKEEIK